MTAVLILFMFVAFVGIDFLVRTSLRRMRESRERQAREAVLNTAIRLDFTHEAKSLKRVAVPNPKARILAVDDESVVLDSFRRILVLEGFSVDTVEHGPEALGLAVSWGIVEAHGGSLEVQSEPGQGTRFTLRLPTAIGAESGTPVLPTLT